MEEKPKLIPSLAEETLDMIIDSIGKFGFIIQKEKGIQIWNIKDGYLIETLKIRDALYLNISIHSKRGIFTVLAIENEKKNIIKKIQVIIYLIALSFTIVKSEKNSVFGYFSSRIILTELHGFLIALIFSFSFIKYFRKN